MTFCWKWLVDLFELRNGKLIDFERKVFGSQQEIVWIYFQKRNDWLARDIRKSKIELLVFIAMLYPESPTSTMKLQDITAASHLGLTASLSLQRKTESLVSNSFTNPLIGRLCYLASCSSSILVHLLYFASMASPVYRHLTTHCKAIVNIRSYWIIKAVVVQHISVTRHHSPRQSQCITLNPNVNSSPPIALSDSNAFPLPIQCWAAPEEVCSRIWHLRWINEWKNAFDSISASFRFEGVH